MIPVQATSEDEELETILRERIEQMEQVDPDDVAELVQLYSRAGRQAEAVPYLEDFVRSAEYASDKAWGFLRLGQMMEQLQHPEHAVGYYEQGAAIAHPDGDVQYFLNNNLAFCLCELARYEEAERYARSAVAIDPDRHNAHKNLAIALEGQTRFAEAASSYVRATEISPGDSRALMHLEEMISGNPSVLEAVPELHESLRICRRAVERERDGFH